MNDGLTLVEMIKIDTLQKVKGQFIQNGDLRIFVAVPLHCFVADIITFITGQFFLKHLSGFIYETKKKNSGYMEIGRAHV